MKDRSIVIMDKLLIKAGVKAIIILGFVRGHYELCEKYDKESS